MSTIHVCNLPEFVILHKLTNKDWDLGREEMENKFTGTSYIIDDLTEEWEDNVKDTKPKSANKGKARREPPSTKIEESEEPQYGDEDIQEK